MDWTSVYPKIHMLDPSCSRNGRWGLWKVIWSCPKGVSMGKPHSCRLPLHPNAHNTALLMSFQCICRWWIMQWTRMNTKNKVTNVSTTKSSLHGCRTYAVFLSQLLVTLLVNDCWFTYYVPGNILITFNLLNNLIFKWSYDIIIISILQNTGLRNLITCQSLESNLVPELCFKLACLLIPHSLTSILYHLLISLPVNRKTVR